MSAGRLRGCRRSGPDCRRSRWRTRRAAGRPPEVLDVVKAQDLQRVDRDTLVGPVVVDQADPLRTPGGARRVDQGCEVLPPDGGHGVVNGGRAPPPPRPPPPPPP